MFDKLESELAKAMLSIPASNGFEIGSGFAGAVLALCRLFFAQDVDVSGVRNRKVLIYIALFALCAGTDLTGSEHNDEFYMDKAGSVRTRTNRSGGVQVFSSSS